VRPHGKAFIDSRAPRALAICERCQGMVFHDTLRWQMQWRGPRLSNIRLYVCPECYDTPQEQLRTFVLPIDPVPIANPRPENYTEADNPASYLGFAARNNYLPAPTQQLGMNIGSLTLGGNVSAAFDSNANKRFEFCASLANSVSSYGNTVGKYWNADASGMLTIQPSTVAALTNIVSDFVLYAPNDRGFLNSATGITGYRLEGSNDGVSWTTIYSGTTAGGTGETITATTTSQAPYQYHRINIQGDGIASVGIAQAVLNIA
jgi:hypothetical protein